MGQLIETCGFKTAWLFDKKSIVADHIEPDYGVLDVFEIMHDIDLPNGWSFLGTGISGAAGFILTFEIENIPMKLDCEKVESLLRELFPTPPAQEESNVIINGAHDIPGDTEYTVDRWKK